MMAKVRKAEPKETLITGLVEEVELENGSTGVQLDDGDDIYLVIMDRQGKKLLDFVDEEVEVRGIVSRLEDRHKLKIRHFRLLNDYRDVDDENNFFGNDAEDFYDDRD
jgi:hypothetical protein